MIDETSLFLLLFTILVSFNDSSGTNNRIYKQTNEIVNDNLRISLGDHVHLETGVNGIHINIHNKHNSQLSGIIAHDKRTEEITNCQLDGMNSGSGLCLQWKNGHRLEVYDTDQNGVGNTSDIDCVTFNWTLASGGEEFVKDTPEDCYNMSGYIWFGGFEETNQTWPMNEFQIGSSPFVTGDAYHNLEYGDVIESIFISSAGFGIFVEETTPLYLSINNGGSRQLCLKGRVGPDTPFFQQSQPHLLYDVCRSTDITTLWKGMANRYIPKPQSHPSTDVIRHPIWCTWATYKGKINQTAILQFAEGIKKFNFSISQLEIDDNWTPHYGDFIFDTNTFPDAKEMIANLTDLGIPATVWVHWFFNNDSDAFRELSTAGYLLKEYNGNKPLLVSWWRGNFAGVLDFTNSDAVTWYLDKLTDLKNNYNVTSFKFDAGEVKWIRSTRYSVKEELLTPNYFSKKYAEAAYHLDTVQNRQELRVGFRSQAFSNMVRMLDRDSNWSHDLGIKTLIPCALIFGLMGYPYILPDLIGGNAYDPKNIDITVLPEPELYVRWLQASVFLPILQFSVEPWAYKNDSIMNITHKFIQLHERYADKIINLAKNAEQTGHPIVRPLWWIAPTDQNALTLDTEFLLGDDLLVAPVLEKGARSRDIYLPPGLWYDELRNVILNGSTWLRNYAADLNELPYFNKVN